MTAHEKTRVNNTFLAVTKGILGDHVGLVHSGSASVSNGPVPLDHFKKPCVVQLRSMKRVASVPPSTPKQSKTGLHMGVSHVVGASVNSTREHHLPF